MYILIERSKVRRFGLFSYIDFSLEDTFNFRPVAKNRARRGHSGALLPPRYAYVCSDSSNPLSIVKP